jgi:hypothetical protein
VLQGLEIRMQRKHNSKKKLKNDKGNEKGMYRCWMIAHARILIFTIIYAKVEGRYQISMSPYKFS